MPYLEALCVIPARLESTRLEKKLLRTIDGRPLLQFVYENAKRARSVKRVLVACDHPSIKDCVEGFGGEAVLTSPHHTSGTERVAEVAERAVYEIVINLQGDEPLMNAEVIDQVAEALRRDPSSVMSTACIRRSGPQEFSNPNVVKLTKDRFGYALYFSRAPIPHNRDEGPTDFFKHLGIYGYRRGFLLQFAGLSPSLLEQREKLEQLRALDNGFKIKVVETVHDSIGVDTEEDFQMVHRELVARGQVKASHA